VNHYKTLAVTCPHCDHEYTSDEMNECRPDLWELALDEETADLKCPVCDLPFWVKGSYRLDYTTAFAEDLL
jgi:hypothetical protein